MFLPCSPYQSGAIQGTLSDFPRDKVQPRSVSLSDLRKSLKSCPKTVHEEELKQFEDFTKQLGHSGI